MEIKLPKIPYKYYLKNPEPNSSGYVYLEPTLQFQMDSIILNLRKDWDFIIIITGNRETRTGKSVLAMNICSYLSYRLNKPYGIKNIFFRSKEMMKAAMNFPDGSIIHYDEGRETLASSKWASNFQKELLDFFDRSAQKNHAWVIVLPDYFSLKEEIAVAKSEYLINVFRKEEKQLRDLYHEGFRRPVVKLKRGYWTFYSKKRKKKLYEKYMISRKRNYYAALPNLRGKFVNSYPIDEKAYREAKRADAEKDPTKSNDKRVSKEICFRNYLIHKLDAKGKKTKEIIEFLEDRFAYSLGNSTIRAIVQQGRKSFEKF